MSQTVAIDFHLPLSDFSKTTLFLFETALLLGNPELTNTKISEKFDVKMEMMEIFQLT